jgi:hypothetical protein
LQRYKTSLEEVLTVRQRLDGLLPPVSDQSLYRPEPVSAFSEGDINRSEQPNTLETARTVLRNAGGKEKSVNELRAEIRTIYGIHPAKTLDQMLAKRASANRGFYKTADGRFGLTELRAQPMIEEVKTSSTVPAEIEKALESGALVGDDSHGSFKNDFNFSSI